VGQIIAQLLSEQLIPFVALDVSSARVAVGKKKDVPVYFGDAGERSPAGGLCTPAHGVEAFRPSFAPTAQPSATPSTATPLPPSGSSSVMHLVGAERAACAIIALDTPGANYRAV
jgi:hypothetical protein